MKQTLNERLAVLEWLGKGCPEGSWASTTYKTSCQALQNRGLVTALPCMCAVGQSSLIRPAPTRQPSTKSGRCWICLSLGLTASPARTLAETLGDIDPALGDRRGLACAGVPAGPEWTSAPAGPATELGQEMTQAGIGAEIGLSQTHVSRILSRTLRELRPQLLHG